MPKFEGKKNDPNFVESPSVLLILEFLVLYFIQYDEVKNECMLAFLSAPRSLHLPYESNGSWRRKRKKNNTSILDKLLQSKVFLFP